MNRNEMQNNTELNDLTVNAEIKGGPSTQSKRAVVLKSDVGVQAATLNDLEPQGDVVGGVLVGVFLPAVQKVR